MSLYQKCRTCHFGSIATEFGEDQCPDCSSTMFVPVEPCEHGNYDPHITFINEHGSVTVLKRQCPGAGIGEMP